MIAHDPSDTGFATGAEVLVRFTTTGDLSGFAMKFARSASMVTVIPPGISLSRFIFVPSGRVKSAVEVNGPDAWPMETLFTVVNMSVFISYVPISWPV